MALKKVLELTATADCTLHPSYVNMLFDPTHSKSMFQFMLISEIPK